MLNLEFSRAKTRIPNLEFSNIKIFHNPYQKVITLQNKKVNFLAITPILLKNLSNSLIFFFLYLNVKLIFRGGGGGIILLEFFKKGEKCKKKFFLLLGASVSLR